MNRAVFAIAALIPAVCLTAASNTYTTNINPDPGTVVAQINGTKITLGEFEQKRAASLFQARNTYYQAERKALDDFIDDYLLQQQAQREGISVAELLKRHVDSVIPKDPSEEALRVYYEGVDTKEPFEAVRGQILDNLHERRREKARAAYLQTLRNQAKLTVSLPPPRADVGLQGAATLGDPSLPVVFLEYADYECPYCQQIDPVLKKLQTEYKGRVLFAYKDTPLPMHTHAEKAAEAGRCAEAQGKFWPYHDMLFATKQLEVPELKQAARSLNLDTKAFDTCLDSGAEAAKVSAELADAAKLGLTGTPTFFINGRIVAGSVSYEALRDVIDQELASSEQPKQTAKR